MKSFEDLSDRELELISHALYQTYSSMLLPKHKRKEKQEDEENVLQRRINEEIKYRKEKDVYNNGT
jgi:hypothetical protein